MRAAFPAIDLPAPVDGKRHCRHRQNALRARIGSDPSRACRLSRLAGARTADSGWSHVADAVARRAAHLQDPPRGGGWIVHERTVPTLDEVLQQHFGKTPNPAGCTDRMTPDWLVGCSVFDTVEALDGERTLDKVKKNL